MRLTATNIRALSLPRGKDSKIFFDEDLPGFGLRLQGDSRTWVVQYAVAGKTRRMSLGPATALDPGKARNMAKDLLAAVRLGRDPAGEKSAARAKVSETLGALLPTYMTRQRARLKPRSYRENERHLTLYAKPLHGHAVTAIDRRMVAILLTKIAAASGPTCSNRVRASLAACFAWLVREGLVETNPIVNTNKAAEAPSRDRVLTDDELARIWRASGDNQFAAIVRLLLLTGARRDEIFSLRWSEIDFDLTSITLPPERTKSRRPHEIPLTPPAADILRAQPRRSRSDGSPRDLVFGIGEGAFQGGSKSKVELDARIADGGPIPHWTLHDFRRTLSTTMHERLGVAPHVVEAVLGHVSGHKGGVAGVYNKALYRVEKRRALELWATHVLAVVEGRPTKVVPLRA